MFSRLILYVSSMIFISQNCAAIECKPGTKRFAGQCLGISGYGEKCMQQYECSQSGDGHLHCINHVCLCGNNRIYDQNTKKCEKNKNLPQVSKNTYNFNKMTPRQSRQSVVKLDDTYKDITHVR